ncbi:hypothetical protein [Engelhardtia mirabilis]
MRVRLPSESSPGRLARCRLTSLEAKRRRLRRWFVDELAQLIADDDGMPAGAPARLDEVLRAMNELDGHLATYRKDR